MKSGNLNFLEPSGPLQVCNGTDLPLPYTHQTTRCQSKKVDKCIVTTVLTSDINNAMFAQDVTWIDTAVHMEGKSKYSNVEDSFLPESEQLACSTGPADTSVNRKLSISLYMHS